MAAGTIITDAELLAMSLASEALSGESTAARLAARIASTMIVLASAKKRYDVDAAWLVDDPSGDDEETVAPAELKDAAAALAAFRLIAHRGVSDRDPTKIVVDDRHKAAREFLKALSDGEDAELVDVDPTKGSVLVATSGSPKWTRAAMGRCS